MFRTVFLLHNDCRRRAAISHGLRGGNLHFEPLESVGELPAQLPSDGLLLVHDCAGTLDSLFRRMTSFASWLPVICYAEAPPIAAIVTAIRTGAAGYLAWPFGREELDAAMLQAAANAEENSSHKLREAKARGKLARLTPREHEVLAGVVDGLSNRLIGQKLAISPRTVEIHRANMLNKMGATHTCEAIRIAIESAAFEYLAE